MTLLVGPLADGVYYIKFKSYTSSSIDSCYQPQDSTLKTDTFTVHAPASIPTISPQAITIYPNPVQDIIHLNLPAGTTLQKAEIHDMQGRLLRSYSDKEPVNAADLPKGLYLLNVVTDKGTQMAKFTRD